MDSHRTESVNPADLPTLAELAQNHCTVPYVLPYLKSVSNYPFLKSQVKNMMLNYYQIEHFTRLTVSLLRDHNIDCYLLKGLSLAACYPVPEYRKLGDLDLYLADPADLSTHRQFWKAAGMYLKKSLMITIWFIVILFQRQAAVFCWNFITALSDNISTTVPINL